MAGFAVSINGWTWVSTEEPIVQALRTQTQDFNVQAPEGCFVCEGVGTDFDAVSDTALLLTGLQKPTRDILARERQLGLIRFVHSSTPLTLNSRIPTLCESAVRSAVKEGFWFKPPFAKN